MDGEVLLALLLLLELTFPLARDTQSSLKWSTSKNYDKN